MIQITHFDHVTVIITNVNKARDFYKDVLGLVEVAPSATFDFVALWFKIGSGYLHLLQKPVADTISPRHFCLHIEDVPGARLYLQSLKIPFDETVGIPGCDRIFIRDPDGNRIELLNWKATYQPEKNGRFSA